MNGEPLLLWFATPVPFVLSPCQAETWESEADAPQPRREWMAAAVCGQGLPQKPGMVAPLSFHSVAWL